jgi:RNA polymerase sigma-70 factor (ECF subfamily)
VRGELRTRCTVITAEFHVADQRPMGRVWVIPEAAVAVRDMDDARDRDLLRRVRDGDPAGEAFRALFRRNAGVAKTVALRVTRSELLAEEAVQEAFLQLWRTPERYDQARSTVRRWLLTLVHARAVDLVRREQSQRRRAEEEGRSITVVPDHAEDVVAEVARPAEQAAVQAALAELPTSQRDVIELMYFQGVSQTGVAERLGIPLGTVKSRSLLAMRKLRTVMVGTER